MQLEKYETNFCGEGGEYETLVLDCPAYHSKINIGKIVKVKDSQYSSYALLQDITTALKLQNPLSPEEIRTLIENLKSEPDAWVRLKIEKFFRNYKDNFRSFNVEQADTCEEYVHVMDILLQWLLTFKKKVSMRYLMSIKNVTAYSMWDALVLLDMRTKIAKKNIRPHSKISWVSSAVNITYFK